MLLRFLGSVLFSVIFLASAYNSITNWDGMLAFTAQKMQPLGLTPELVSASFGVSVGLKLLGALLLVVGVFNATLRKLGAITLILFLLPVTFIVHDFWNQQGHAQQVESANFFKNVALIGALLCFLESGSSSAASSKREAGKREVRAANGRKGNAKKVD